MRPMLGHVSPVIEELKKHALDRREAEAELPEKQGSKAVPGKKPEQKKKPLVAGQAHTNEEEFLLKNLAILVDYRFITLPFE